MQPRTVKKDKGDRRMDDQREGAEDIGGDDASLADAYEHPDTDATDVLGTTTSTTAAEGEGDMATKKTATKKASKKSAPKAASKPKAKASTKPKAAKAEAAETPARTPKVKAVKVPKVTFDKLPSVGELTLATVKTEEKNRYVTLEFVNGYVVRLQPCNVDNGRALETRTLLAAWFTKHLL